KHRIPDNFIEQWTHITLALAAANGHHSIVKILWQQGALLDVRVDQFGETALSAAAANGHAQVVSFLIEKGAQLLQEDITPLHRAAERGHANVASIILQSPHVNYPGEPHLSGALDRDGKTPLHKAARNGHAEVVRVLLDYAPVAKDEWLYTAVRKDRGSVTDGCNAYHLAVANGHLAVVQLLPPEMDTGAIKTNSDSIAIKVPKAIDLAVEGNHISTAKWLIEQNQKRGEYAYDLRAALKIAVEEGHEEMVLLLLDSQLGMVNVDLVKLAAVTRHGMILESLLDSHRRGGTAIYNESTQKLLSKAWKQAKYEGQLNPALLLRELSEQEF
ncbi:MAG: hypothetical protein Q9174_006509, partial [Haloplaca sp. 1 TL-2023]